MRWKSRILVLAAAAAALAAVVAKSSPAAPSGSCPNGQIRFGVEPYEDPAKLTPAYQTLAKSLQATLGCPVKVQIVQTYTAEVLAMKNNKLDIAEFGPLGFVFANQLAKAQPLVSFADSKGKLTTYKAGIWVPKDSSIKSIADLKGHSLALSEPGSTSGDALPRYAIRKAGMKEKDLKIEYAGGHPESLLALVNGKVDAAEINTQQQASAAAEGKFKASDYRQIWSSAPIPNDPITINPKLPASFKASVKKALTNMKTADVSKVSTLLGIDPPGGLVKVTKATYKQLFDLAAVLGLTIKDA